MICMGHFKNQSNTISFEIALNTLFTFFKRRKDKNIRNGKISFFFSDLKVSKRSAIYCDLNTERNNVLL